MRTRKNLALLLAALLIVCACTGMALPAEEAEGTPAAQSPTPSVSPTPSASPTPSESPTPSVSPTPSATPALGYAVLTQVTTTSLINRDSRLPEGYVPENLVKMKEYNTSGNLRLESASIRIHPEAAAALDAMMAAAKADGVEGFILDNAYRSHEKQTAMFNRKLKKDPQYGQDRSIPLTTAIPGASEHEAGLAIDICGKKHRRMNQAFGESVYGQWLRAHCHEYGYILRYPKGKEQLTGIAYEPWHYRYVGVALATTLHEKNWTLEEYYAGQAAREKGLPARRAGSRPV